MIASTRGDVEQVFVSYAEQLRREGRKEGLSEGRKQGREEGARESLQLVLRARFGDLPTEVEHRLSAATAETLRAWLHRAGLIESLDELFRHAE